MLVGVAAGATCQAGEIFMAKEPIEAGLALPHHSGGSEAATRVTSRSRN